MDRRYRLPRGSFRVFWRPMPDIVLTTLNAKYIHAAFGLRYLLANLGELQERAVIAEFDINQRPLDIVEAMLAREPRIVGFGVYIWNVAQTTEVVALLKRLRPDVAIVLGGPEVSYETDQQEIVRLADYVITGEADLAVRGSCAGSCSRRASPPQRSSPRSCRELDAARACPTSSTPTTTSRTASSTSKRRAAVRSRASSACRRSTCRCAQLPLEPFLAAHADAARPRGEQFKFVDRTFNLNLNVSRAILEFFLER